MVLEENEELIEHLKAVGALRSKNVEDAMRKYPRHHFVPEILRQVAYEDVPLHIGSNQTVSQPLTVVTMTEALDVKNGNKVLEIGTGSGWQSTLLSYLVGDKGCVFTMEIIEDLFRFARDNLSKSGIRNVTTMLGDGSGGLEKEAPFDRILVTAAAPRIPEALIDQLKPDGILVIPVGDMIKQEMFVLRKTEKRIDKVSIGEFALVPLVGKYGFRK